MLKSKSSTLTCLIIVQDGINMQGGHFLRFTTRLLKYSFLKIFSEIPQYLQSDSPFLISRQKFYIGLGFRILFKKFDLKRM